VSTPAGAAAARFVHQAEDADEDTVQGLLARATGNFKRGNQRRS
jgi:hypothetical protein